MKATLLAIIAITWASLTSVFPEMPLVEAVPFYDKWAHFVMYATLSLAVQWDCRRSAIGWGGAAAPRPHSRRSWCAALPLFVRRMACFFLFPALWGTLMEVAQATLTTWRSGDPLDALANTVGAALGTAAGALLSKVVRNFRTKKPRLV